MHVPKYHIYIEYAEPEKSGIRFNVTQEELVRTFVTPFTAGQPFWFMGRLLNPLKVTKAVLFWSYEPADKLILPNQENFIVAKDKKYLIDNVLKGKIKGTYICTEKFLPPAEKAPTVQTSATASSALGSIRRRIFVVSGLDDEMKQAVSVSLTKLGLAPVVMREEPSQGKKIIARFADYADVGFAVVLLSPDDFVYAREEAPAKRKLRPQQDVIFELGFLLGKLGKSNVLVFYRECENFATPDFEGIKFTAFDDRDSWKLALVRELTNTGYTLDVERMLR